MSVKITNIFEITMLRLCEYTMRFRVTQNKFKKQEQNRNFYPKGLPKG